MSAKIGDLVTVCVNRTTLEFTDEQISAWLEHYGKIEGEFIYVFDKLGYATDSLEVEVKLKKHIPEYLPMYGRKVRIFYLGMKRQCNNCLEIGHWKTECENESKDWFSFIEELMESGTALSHLVFTPLDLYLFPLFSIGDFELELFGEYPDVIKRKRKETQSKPSGRGARGNGRGHGRGRGRGRGK